MNECMNGFQVLGNYKHRTFTFLVFLRHQMSGLFVLEDHHLQNGIKILHTKQMKQLANLLFFVWQAGLHCQNRAQWPFSV